MRRPVRMIVSSLAVVVGTLAASTSAFPAAAATATQNGVTLNGYEASLASAVNDARAARGLRRLVVVPGATDVARRWSWHLAGAQVLGHNPSLVTALEHAGSSAWTEIAENVGTASATDPGSLFRAYMASPAHKANILDAGMRYLGIGVVERAGIVWNTMDFVNAYSTSYGRTRVPPAGITLDTVTVTAATTLASLESPDQRVGTSAAPGVKASLVHFSAPTAGNDRASATFRRTASTGHGDLFLRVPADLRQVRSLSLQLGASTSNGRPVAVQVLAGRAYGSAVSLGTLTVGTGAHWFTLPLPAGAQAWRDTVTLRVSSGALGAVGGTSTVSVWAVDAAT
jgi:uncharacterized protein YkwD